MSIVRKAKNIIMTPKTEWVVIAAEESNENDMFFNYAIPLIIIIAAVVFIGYTFIWRGGFNETETFVLGAYFGIQTVFIGAFGVWLTATVLNALAPNFGSEKNKRRAMHLVVYTMTPALALVGSWWCPDLIYPPRGFGVIFPPIGIIFFLLFGSYGLYLLYLGLPHVMKTPQDKRVRYMVITTVILLLICIALGFIYRFIIWGMIENIKISARPDK